MFKLKYLIFWKRPVDGAKVKRIKVLQGDIFLDNKAELREHIAISASLRTKSMALQLFLIEIL